MSMLKILKNGHKLVIFPEGTRNKTGTSDLQELKDGTGFLSVKSKCPIVPVMMLQKAKVFRRTKIMVGKPFYFEEYYDKKLTNEDLTYMNGVLRDQMIAQQNKLKQLKKGKNDNS